MSTKISDLVAITSVDDSGLLNVVQNGQNFKISQADYLAQFGVTGSLVQVGAPTGTPVLDTQGTVNGIRNLEGSVGIKTSLSPQNGLRVQTDLLTATTGVPVLFNETTAPKFRSLIAGSGMNVALAGDNIQISLSGTPASTKTVIVNQMADFPTAVGGVRTLEPDTDYFMTADLSTADRFIMQSSTVLRGPDILIGMLEYTGTGIFITAVDATCKITAVQVEALSGTFCAISNSAGNEGTTTFILDRVSVAANEGGTLTSLDGHQSLQSVFTFITNGFTYAGTGWTNLNFDGFRVTQLAGKFVDMGSITFDRPLFNNFSMALSAGTFGISGIASSGNINAGGVGIITIGRTTGAGTLLENITSNDALWTFAHNDDIPDSRTDGLLSLQGNATATVIAATGTPVLVAGTWVVEETGRMTGTTGGRLTHDAGAAAKLPITASVTIEPVSGGSQSMSVYVAVDGTEVANSQRTATASPGSPVSITVPWQENLASGAFSEVFVANDSGTTNVLVSSAIHRIN